MKNFLYIIAIVIFTVVLLGYVSGITPPGFSLLLAPGIIAICYWFLEVRKTALIK